MRIADVEKNINLFTKQLNTYRHLLNEKFDENLALFKKFTAIRPEQNEKINTRIK